MTLGEILGYCDRATYRARKRVCDECPSNNGIRGPLERCNECGCFLKLKRKLNDSECPLRKWPK